MLGIDGAFLGVMAAPLAAGLPAVEPVAVDGTTGFSGEPVELHQYTFLNWMHPTSYVWFSSTTNDFTLGAANPTLRELLGRSV